MKKFFSTLSSTLYGGVRGGLLFLALLTTSNLWAYDYDFEHNEIRYKIISETGLFGTVEVVGSYTNYATHFTIPQTVIHGAAAYEVIRIGDQAFNNHKTITDIELPNSITSIGKGAFYNSTLKEITIPNNVTDIEESAFKSCTKLTSATLGNNVMTIGEDAFYNCTGLTSITIPNSVTTIGEFAFSGCSSLTSVTFGNSVTSIGEGAFSGCSLLTSVTIPESVTNMSANPFSECSALTSIVWNAKKCTDPFNVYHLVFGDICTQITSFTFGENVEYIPEHLCEGMDNLNTITIPLSVTGIGSKAFLGCSSISSVIWNAKNCTDFNYSDGSPFSLISSITSFTFGDRVEYIPASLCRGMSNLSSITIPNSVEDIGGHAFAGCSGLTSVTIGNSVMTIGQGAFSSCSALTSITIPNSVTSIGEHAFHDCSGLTSVTIPNSVTSIGGYAFYECSSLTSVIIGNGVTSIGNYAFKGCSGLTSITIPNRVVSIGDNAFYNCNSLTEISIPKNVKEIGKYMFANCLRLKSVIWDANITYNNYKESPFCNSPIESIVITDNVKYIPEYLCCNIQTLKIITLGKNLTSIGEKAFYNCTGLTQVNYTGDVASWCKVNFTYINDNPNYYAKNLYINGEKVTDVVIPNTIKTINPYTFYGCSELSSLVLPKSVTSIGNYAFGECRKLYDIYCYPTIPPTAEESSFANYNVNLYVPCESLKDYQMDMVFGSFKYIQCLEDLIPSEPQDTTITHSAEMVTICEGEEFTWYGNEYSKSGTYTHTETEETEEYIYHHVYTLELMILPTETIEYVIEAEDSYEWHDEVYTESGEYKYITVATNGCDSTEVLLLTIISSDEDEPNSPNKIYYTSSDGNIVIPNATDVFGANIISNTYEKGQGVITFDGPVTSIGDRAFQSCFSLTSVTIPHGVTSIGDRAFSRCTSLPSITIPDNVTSIAALAFYGCSSLSSITIPNSVISIGDNALNTCESLTSITLGNGLTSIESNAFSNCPLLTTVTIDSDVLVSTNYTVSSSSMSTIFGKQVKKYVIGNSVTAIGEWAFSYCDSLTSVTIGSSVTSIGDLAFRGCKVLTSVDIPNNVTTIGEWTFAFCNSLSSVTLGNGVTTIGEKAFTSCKSLFSINIPNSVTSIGDQAFYLCDSLTSVTLGNSVTSIESSTFCGCKSLSSINIPNSVTSIGDYSFLGCSSLTSITLGNSVTNIGYAAFSSCAFTSITIPNSVTTIGDYAFNLCSSLTSITLGSSVTNIGDSAFVRCYSLDTIYCHAANPPMVESNTFINNDETNNYEAKLYVPCESLADYKAHDVWSQFSEIDCIKSNKVETDTVVIDASTTSVTITWPTEIGADSYTIIITKDGEVFCTLTFDSEGRLLNIAFSPGRNGNHPVQYAEQAANGYRFTVTGLESGTKYNYTITTKDSIDQTISTYSGEFTTQSNVSTSVSDNQYPITDTRKEYRDGQLLIIRDGVEYNALGIRL